MTLTEAKKILKNSNYKLIKEDLDVNTLEFPLSSVYGFLHNQCGLDWEPKDTDESYLGINTIYITKLNDGTPIMLAIDYEGWVDSVRIGTDKNMAAQAFIDLCKEQDI